MKLIYHIIVALLLCSIATASMEEIHPYTIYIIIWDEEGNSIENTAVTFEYMGQSETLYTAEDGSASFSLLNFEDIRDGVKINVSCKYGGKLVPVNYEYGATGVTFNEPDQATSIAAFAAMGFVVITAGGGLYYLKQKKKGSN